MYSSKGFCLGDAWIVFKKNNLTNLILGFGARNIYNSNESFLFIDTHKKYNSLYQL